MAGYPPTLSLSGFRECMSSMGDMPLRGRNDFTPGPGGRRERERGKVGGGFLPEIPGMSRALGKGIRGMLANTGEIRGMGGRTSPHVSGNVIVSMSSTVSVHPGATRGRREV